MKKSLIISVVMAMSANVFAGANYGQETVIIGNSASGVLSWSRHSADTVQHIGCTLYSDQSGSGGLCVARDKSGNTLFCETTDPEMLKVIATLNPESKLSFSADASSECTGVSVEMTSIFIRQ